MELFVTILTDGAVEKLGWTLIHFIWQATAVALLLAILLKVLRRSTANLRYIIACSAFGLIILLPIVTMQLVPVSAPIAIVNIEPAPTPAVLPAEPEYETPMPLAETIEFEELAQPEDEVTNSVVPWKQRAVERLESALPYIVSGWLIGVFGLSIWHLGGWAQLQRLRKKMVRQADSSLQDKIKLLAERLGVNRTVQLLESALVQIPTVIGWLRPVILLPASAMTGLNTEQLEAILAHELAHIKRFDYLINMLQTVVEILGFYHPAVWWISHRIRAERENCCDDVAVAISGDRICYARALTSMEEIRGRSGELAVAASGGNLFKRIRRLLGKDSNEKTAFSWIPSATVILLIAALLIPTALAFTSGNQTELSAESLLDKMLEHQSKVKNLQYVTEYDIWISTKFTDLIREHTREMKRENFRKIGIPEEQIQRMTSSTGQEPESRYEVLKCTVDNLERIKIERTTGTYDSSGNKLSDRKYISSWNGTLGIDFHQRRGSPGSVTITDTTVIDALQRGHPWKTWTIHNRELADAIKNKRQIKIEELKNSFLRMILYYETSKVVAVIDPSQDYACTLWENYNDGKLTSRSTAKYEEMAKGIWFPVNGHREGFNTDGSLNMKTTFKTSRIIINDPSFDESYFSVDLPDGVHVTDLVRSKQYIVGSQNEYDLVGQDEGISDEDREKTEHIDPNSWQKAFNAIYCLEDVEVLKRIAPPFIPERRNYYLKLPRPPSSDDNYNMASQYVFNWDDELSIKFMGMGSLITRLDRILGAVIGLSNFEYDIPNELLYTNMSGDWIVRKDTPKEVLLKSLEKIIKVETEREITFVRKKVENDIIIAQGQYRFEPLPGNKNENYILLSTNKTDTYVGGGGGRGTVSEFLRWIGSRVNMNIINETEYDDTKIFWRNHDSSNLHQLRYDDEKYNEQLDLLLNNLSLQTGLTFKKTKATAEKWFIAEHGNISSQKTNVRAETFAPSALEPIGRHALYFDGVDDYLYVPASPTLEPKPPFTIEMWIKPDFSDCERLQASEEEFFGPSLLLKGKKPDDVGKEQAGGFCMTLLTSSRSEDSHCVCFYLSTADGKFFQEDGFFWDRSEGGQSEWIHVSVSCRRSEMYVPVPDLPLVIGDAIRPPIILPPFKGEIAEIRIWNKKLTDEDIQKHGYKSLTGSEPNLVACWDFERPGGQIVYDISPNKNHARLGKLPEADDADPNWVDLTATSNQPDQKPDVRTEARITSNKKIQDLGKAMVRYMDDNQQILPDNLQDFAPYLSNKQDIDWLSQNVTYLGKGKTMQNMPDTVIAYDHSLLDSDNGTNVLFLDAHVEFVNPEKLKELGIKNE